MWQVDRRHVQSLISSLHTFVVEFLNNAYDLQAAAPNLSDDQIIDQVPEPMKTVLRAVSTVRTQFIRCARSAYLPEVRREYLRITVKFERFLARGAYRQCMSAPAETLADEVFLTFYESLFDSSTFWKHYPSQTGLPLSLKGFRQQIKEFRVICPFCDINEIDSSIDTNTDHFLPKSEYSLLSVYWLNLVVGCIGCNQQAKGSKLVGTRRYNPPRPRQGGPVPFETGHVPIFHPYLNQAADSLLFTFKEDSSNATEAELDVKPGISKRTLKRANNFLNLFQLRTKYHEKRKKGHSAYQEVEFYFDGVWDEAIAQGEPASEGLVRRILRQTIDALRRKCNGARGAQPYSKLKLDFYDHVDNQFDAYVYSIVKARGITP